MNPSVKSSLPALLAFGAASAAGVVAAMLLAPASGHHTRTRMAARIHSWTKRLTGRHHHTPAGHGHETSLPSTERNLSMQPDHLLPKH
jgi:gas vesicle protein